MVSRIFLLNNAVNPTPPDSASSSPPGFLTASRGAASPTLSGLIRSLRTLPRAAWILFLGIFLNKFGAFVIPYLALYMTRQGFSAREAGLAMAAYGVGHLLASAIGGHLADTIGRRKTIALSMFSAAASMMLLSQARTFSGFLWLTGLTGLASELYRPASQALLTDLVPAGQRVTAFSAYRLALNAGWAFGPATAGLISEQSFFWLFAGDAVTSVLFGVVAWVALPHGVRAERKEAGWHEWVPALCRDRAFLQFLAAAFAISLVFPQMTCTFSLHVTSLGFSAATYGQLISLNGVLVVLLELPLTVFSQRFPAPRIIALGYVLIGIGFGLNGWVSTIPALVAGVIIFTFGEMIAMPVSAAFVADLAPPHLRGRYMGVMGFTWATGLIFAPTLGMALFEQKPVWLWAACGISGLTAAMIIMMPRKSRHD